MTFAARTVQPIAYQEPSEMKACRIGIEREIKRLRKEARECDNLKKKYRLSDQSDVLSKIRKEIIECESIFRNL